MGVIDDVARRLPSGWQDDGENIYLLGTTHLELDGSIWADAIHSHLGGRPPSVDFEAEKALAGLLSSAALQGLVTSAHDLSTGGSHPVADRGVLAARGRRPGVAW